MLLLLLTLSWMAHPQDLHYKMLRSGNIISDKNFYIITVIEKAVPVKKILPAALYKGKEVQLFRFSDRNQDSLLIVLDSIYDRSSVMIDDILDRHIRPSGNYQLFQHLNNKQLWKRCWQLYFTGINYIIDQYGLGKKMRYPDIDSARYTIAAIDDQHPAILPRRRLEKSTVFYEAPVLIAMQLMALNKRDEPARHEPLQKKQNKAAHQRIRKINFDLYKYSALVVPGDGPQQYIQLAPASIERCQLAAAKYFSNIAPVIILTGGYCHPFQTPYAESVEMKKYLVDTLRVPASSIIIDPHARHTTTNFRNAARYIIRYGLPVDKPALMVTSANHADYMMDKRFDERNIKELGFVPYTGKTRISAHEISFYPAVACLHRDPADPLDP
jgi:hypothetical protein